MSCSKDRGEISQNQCCEIEWTFYDIFSYTKMDESHHSPPFSAFDSNWCLSIVPNGAMVSGSFAWIGVYLFRIDDWKLPMSVQLSFGVRKADGKVKVIRSDVTHVFDKKDAGFGIVEFLQVSQMKEKKSRLTTYGTLTVTCTMNMKDDVDVTWSLIELSDKFKTMLTSKKDCDTTVKVQDYEFPVHKSFLASRSAVFEAMFQADMKERNTGIVDIDDSHPEAFKDFLEYIYCGQFENTGDVIELYKIAHKYCVEGLRSACLHFILDNLSVDNVLDAFILGCHCDESELKWQSEKFFEEHFVDVVTTDKWGSLLKENPLLGNTLLVYVANGMKIKQIGKK